MDKVQTKTELLSEVFSRVFNAEIAKGFGNALEVAFDTLNGALTITAFLLDKLTVPLDFVMKGLGFILQFVALLLSPISALFEGLNSNNQAIKAWSIVGVSAIGVAIAFTAAMKTLSWVTKLGNGSFAEGIKFLKDYIACSLKAIWVKIRDTAITKAQAIAQWWHNASLAAKLILVSAGALAGVAITAGIVAATMSDKGKETESSVNMPAMAKGGVVSAPTVALIGEGRYKEAVVPLGSSPQFKTMKEDIANEVLRRMSPNPPYQYGQRSRASRPVILNLNGREVARGLIPDLDYVYDQV
jgi:hypothetical protein